MAVLWCAGDWEQLSQLDAGSLADHPDRIRLQMMLAFACAVQGHTRAAREHLLQAEAWGAARPDLQRVLSAGIAYGLACSRARLAEIEHAEDHLQASLAMFPGLEDVAGAVLVQSRRLSLLTLCPDPVAAWRKLKQRRVQATMAEATPALPLVPARIMAETPLGPALADLPVNNADGYGGFAMVEAGGRQFCAYFDRDRDLVIAHRRTNAAGPWQAHRPGEQIGWDSHNYLAMAVDDQGLIHLAGNMHASPLRYYRSSSSLDPTSLQRVEVMTGRNEDRVTYPKFFRRADGTLLFSYRDGSSGSGNILINAWSPETQRWRRILNQPLLDGQGIANPYMHGPVPGPDGWFHACWVWRCTPEAETNHSLSYARSVDLESWTDSAGNPLSLPITQRNGELVAPVRIGQGMINNNHLIGFDSTQRPMITFQRNDNRGDTQLFIARLEAGNWVSRQITDWSYRWAFSGRGSLAFEITILPACPISGGLVVQEYEHRALGSGSVILDETTLEPLGVVPMSLLLPHELRQPADRGLRRNIAFDWTRLLGEGSFPILIWDSLPENRDRPQGRSRPFDSTLRLVTVARGGLGEALGADKTWRHSATRTPASTGGAMDRLLESTFGRAENAEAERLANHFTVTALETRLRDSAK